MAKKRAKKKVKGKKKTFVYSSKMKAIDFLKFVALLLPLTVYVSITAFIIPSPNSGFITLGIIGSFILGVGLVDITGYLDDANIGGAFSGILLGLGSVLIGISCVIMYIPAIYAKFNEQQVTFYFVIGAFLVASAIYYIFFRGAMKMYMRTQGASKSHISTLLQGTENFWLYKAANESLNLKWRYHINKLYVFLYVVCCIAHLLLGWCKIFSPVIALCTVVLFSLNIPMHSLVISTYDEWPGRGDGSKLIFGYLLPIGGIAATIILTTNLLFA